ncbi:superfamily I DNA and RNA helicase [Rhizobium sp. BK650]|uniref:DEAD/DEAH box helicase n=1 Tax=Rhizobium sp. BK650 TaxID=2586990 RepID=UPI00161881BC|nr:ATP-binding domain-containing protein [Rhizobium sp. BK650]MBB3656829.1 superfamily I DNA and RNA helicase [Rhizobium sp. BK650]
MASSFFFLQAEKNDTNKNLIDQIERWADETKTQAYVIDRPLGDSKYSYDHDNYIVLLSPKRRITFIDFSGDEDSFDSFVDDFIEDLGSISDKYRYKESIGRPRSWKRDLVSKFPLGNSLNLQSIQDEVWIEDPAKQRIAELLVSLLSGSINDIERVRADPPGNLLEKVKRKILLFDGDQTRFVYQKLKKSPIRIQGLSGTGKTELLLHKLKELYIQSPDSKIVMTCHNRILADSLKRRIPDFFNFMKVEQQIKWDERLWCVHAWGSSNDRNSGTYRYICDFYGIPFQRYSYSATFDRVCAAALAAIKDFKERKYAFDYILIDESQDFPESFFQLCEYVCKETVFIAGDIFQSIFDETITASISPDFLLSKCYRTDPKTLMFAHSVGMGLFESRKLRWLEDDEWVKCGYSVEKKAGDSFYRLKREPLRRFEDIEKENIDCVEIVAIDGEFTVAAAKSVVEIVLRISHENPTLTADDVGIILLDNNNRTYALADMLEQMIPRATGWNVNKAHETKQRIKSQLFVSNRNNVKGLEFPFVICVTGQIGQSYAYRNALYMTITRSFIKSFLVVSSVANNSVLENLRSGLKGINELGYIEVQPPSEAEKERIRTTIKHSNANESFYDFVQKIFDEIDVLPLFRSRLLDVVKNTVGEDFDHDNVFMVAEFNYKMMLEHGDLEDI